MQGELRQGQVMEGAGYVEVVDDLTICASIEGRRTALKADEQRLEGVELQAGVIVGAIAEQGKVEIQAASERHFAAHAR